MLAIQWLIDGGLTDGGTHWPEQAVQVLLPTLV